MRYLINKIFQKDLKNYKLGQEYIKDVLGNIFAGRAKVLGACIYKIRAARKGKGKSGGFRNIFFWKKDNLIIFCQLFPKNIKENISKDEMTGLKKLSKVYSELTKDEIKEMIKTKTLEEIHYDK